MREEDIKRKADDLFNAEKSLIQIDLISRILQPIKYIVANSQDRYQQIAELI